MQRGRHSAHRRNNGTIREWAPRFLNGIYMLTSRVDCGGSRRTGYLYHRYTSVLSRKSFDFWLTKSCADSSPEPSGCCFRMKQTGLEIRPHIDLAHHDLARIEVVNVLRIGNVSGLPVQERISAQNGRSLSVSPETDVPQSVYKKWEPPSRSQMILAALEFQSPCPPFQFSPTSCRQTTSMCRS
jgi:hypothetical protein